MLGLMNLPELLGLRSEMQVLLHHLHHPSLCAGDEERSRQSGRSAGLPAGLPGAPALLGQVSLQQGDKTV